MSVQTQLYTSVERKLVLWCLAAMLIMSTSFIVPVYLVVSNWLDHSTDMRQAHHGLILTLVLVQAIVVAVGAALSLAFARKALRPIRKAHQAQADFAANAHHQLRTPIAVMQAEIDTALLRKDQQPKDYQRTLKSLLDELRTLRTTSEQLLLQADGVTAKSAHQTSKDIADAVVALERRYVLPINADISPDVATTLSLDELMICLEILLENAQKHAGKPAEALQIELRLDQQDNAACLIYRDNGQGIARGEEKAIFERNTRGRQAIKNKVQGSGLGLAILSDIISSHKGTLTASNVPTGGLEIVISLPQTPKR
ncbi:MAG TPA: HAMP domain-containing sensor histidine kinase [Candidatus Saccharimonadales bacterium]|nr:HAMP domain-containing sensor histidine kinase [Candidatus Saccharimonadales bacterium]